MMDFQFFSPIKLIIGAGKAADAGLLAQEFGEKAFLLVSGAARRHPKMDDIRNSLKENGIQFVEYEKPSGEPDLAMVDDASLAASNARCNMVISIGGGAAIDLGKAVAGLATNGGPVTDYLEGVGAGKKVVNPALPQIAIPTTAGAGAEATKNAVISSKEKRFKKSFRSPYLFPAIAVLDAELSVSLPPEQTAYSGMDAVTQLIESYLSRRATPMTDALALWGLELAFSAIRKVYHHGDDLESREKMLAASTISGICLANAGLGLAHGFAAGLGALFDIPHGKACAILLPHAMKINRDAAAQKLAKIGALLTGDSTSPQEQLVEAAVREIESLNAEFGVPPDLKPLNIPKDEFELLAKMSMGNSMSGNPVEIDEQRALEILTNIA